MKNSRLAIQDKLEKILGSKNVYFQPPDKSMLKYPCIVYSLNDVPTKHADDKKYISNYQYSITLIDYDPDNDFVDKLMKLKYIKFSKHFSTQGLNHYVFTLNYKQEKENN